MKYMTRRRRNNLANGALLGLAAVIGLLGYTVQSSIKNQVSIARAEANTQVASVSAELDAVLKAKDLSEEDNQRLRERLENTTSKATPETVKAISRFYIHQYFPKEIWAKAEAIATCESGLNPLSHNKGNKDGSQDLGVFQINNRWHKARFEKMFGVPFETGAFDTRMNIEYAAFVWKAAGNFDLWVCNRIIK